MSPARRSGERRTRGDPAHRRTERTQPRSRLASPTAAAVQTMSNLLRILLAILLPPVGVLFTVGLGWAFWINILLTLLGYIPGIVHAVWIIARRTP